MSDSLLLCPWDFPGNSTGVDCHFFLQPGIFPTQGSNPGLPHCRQTLYCLSHQRSPSRNITLPERELLVSCLWVACFYTLVWGQTCDNLMDCFLFRLVFNWTVFKTVKHQGQQFLLILSSPLPSLVSLSNLRQRTQEEHKGVSASTDFGDLWPFQADMWVT